MKILFIADFFADQINGGGELNNSVLKELLYSKGHEIKLVNSHKVNHLDIMYNDAIIVSNFVNLAEENKHEIQDKNYVIYEHDHKYLSTRNPAMFKHFKAPREAIVNYEFYKKAKAVFCQSKFHADIVRKNLELDNIINVGGNLWTPEALERLRNLSGRKKSDKCSVMHSEIPHKGTDHAKIYCEKNNLKVDLIMPCSHDEFIEKLGSNSTFAFFPRTPETLSRVVVEARMMNVKIITNGLVGASWEDWFNLKGVDLISLMGQKRETIPAMVVEALDE